MLLSDKYVVKETPEQITLYEVIERNVYGEDKKPTGETKKAEKLLGYYSNSAKGRSQAYNRLINSEISSSEKQDLQEILEIVRRCEEKVKEFWGG